MIERRRAASATGPSTNAPSESGPRCVSVALIAASRSGSAAPRADAIPQIPHMRDYFIHVPSHVSSVLAVIAEFGPRQEVQLLMLLVAAAALLLLADPLRIQ